MQALPSSFNDKTQPWQKVIAGILMAGVVLGILYGSSLIINATFPSITEALKNIWVLLGYGIPLTFLGLYIYQNPWAIWNVFKTISWNITKVFIRMDPLSMMDRCVEYIRKRRKNLGYSIEDVTGARIKLDREVTVYEEKITTNLGLAAAAKKQNKLAEAGTFMVKVKTDEAIRNKLVPLQHRAIAALKLMGAVAENWDTQIEQLTYQIAGKRAESAIINETYKGLKSAEDFINSDNEQARLLGQSIIELENQVTAKMGYMEEFERKSKAIISNMSIAKQADMDAGLAELEEYMRGDTLMLPDFSQTPTVDAQYETVSSGKRKFSLES